MGFFSSGIEDQQGDPEKDEFLLGTIEDYVVEDKEMDRHVNQLNLLAMDRDKAINPDCPVPADMDVSDELRFDAHWYKTYYDTTTVELDKAKTVAAMKEELQYMRSLPVWRDTQANGLLANEKIIPTKWVLVQRDH